MSTKEEMNLPLAACVAHAISAVCELEIHDREIRDRLLIELTTTLRYINNPLVSYEPPGETKGYGENP